MNSQPADARSPAHPRARHPRTRRLSADRLRVGALLGGMLLCSACSGIKLQSQVPPEQVTVYAPNHSIVELYVDMCEMLAHAYGREASSKVFVTAREARSDGRLQAETKALCPSTKPPGL